MIAVPALEKRMAELKVEIAHKYYVETRGNKKIVQDLYELARD